MVEMGIHLHTLGHQEACVKIITLVAQQVMETVVVMRDVLLPLRAAVARVQDQVEIAIRVQHPVIQVVATLARYQQVREAVILVHLVAPESDK